MTPAAAWEALPLPALILDPGGRVAALNDAAEGWLNLSRRALVGEALAAEGGRLRLRPPLASLAARLARGHDAIVQPQVQVETRDPAGGWLRRSATLHLGAMPAGGLVLVIAPDDSAARLRPGRDASRAARSAIGMAEMLAHEIKNPLAGIRGAAQLIGPDLADRPELAELAELIVAESRRIVVLLEQVERFGDTSAPTLAAVDLHQVLERVRRSAELASDGLRIATDYDPSLPQVLADADQLTQVVLNLLRNAVEATGGRGSLRIRSFYDAALRGPRGPLPLQVEVEDDGPGLPEAIAEQVFEPFVSGRENGTGLGLALVAKIVAAHGGWIGVESRPGRTVFRLSLAMAGKGGAWTAPS